MVGGSFTHDTALPPLQVRDSDLRMWKVLRKDLKTLGVCEKALVRCERWEYVSVPQDGRADEHVWRRAGCAV